MKTLLSALFLTLLLPLGASAASRDAATLERCVTTQSSGSKARTLQACLGRFACNDQTTIGIAECLMREQRAWDELLNAWWAPMKARAQKNGSWNRLLASQRKWIKDRDAECARRYEEAGGGSIRVIWGAECQRDLTAKKAVDFFFDLYR
ncbi:lysozyme inhibitor LprI family protein [Salipiger sp.]|uniref:lysozyme inhibitor LprI family protein n=1 Tax=Salipiger sp. TaxID=2078585 RepID=UPI003A97F4D4